MKKSRNPTLPPCGGNICANGSKDFVAFGFCVPGPDTVTLCAKSLGDGCICSIGKSGCSEPGPTSATVIDIYISNKTDQTLHLIKGGEKISITDTSGKTAGTVGWISMGSLDYKPPQMIETAASGADPAFIRGYVMSNEPYCREDRTFSIELQYSIGVPGKKLGNLVIPVCRTKPKGKECLVIPALCDSIFGNITTCSGDEIAINPSSGVYSITAAVLRETQVVIEISGGTTNGNGGATGCTVSPDSCPSGSTCNPNTLKCETTTSGGLSNRQFTILIVVAAVAVLLVILFFGFLILIKRRGEKKK